MQTLSQEKVLFLDCQTNGASAPKAQVIEYGWAVGSAAQPAKDFRSSKVALKEGQALSMRITKLTGISERDLDGAPVEEAIWEEIEASVSKSALIVIHYARFEKSFLVDLDPSLESRLVCTYEIARRIFPDLPSRSIRAVAGYLGHSSESLKKAAEHTRATSLIWKRLVSELEENRIKSREDLFRWLETPPPKKSKKKYKLDPKLRLSLPNKPGVYLMKNEPGEVLYVGKATSLKSRVNSYFRGQKTKGSRLNELVAQISDVETRVVRSSFEAAVVETDLIKKLDPPYNRALKTDTREIAYCDRNFEVALYDTHQLGPFSSRQFVDHVRQLSFLVEAKSLDLDWYEDFDEEFIKKAVEVFHKNYGGGLVMDRCRLIGFWAASVTRQRQRLLDSEEEDGKEEDDVPKEVTPEDLARHMARSFAELGRRVHRSRWLRRLLHSQLRWKETNKDDWQGAVIRGGHVEFCDPRSQVIFDTKLSGPNLEFDIATYDRLQIVLIEIYRLLKEGSRIKLCTGSGSVLENEKIKKYIFPERFLESEWL